MIFDEERLLGQFEPACLRYTANLSLPGMTQDDLLQEARIAVIEAARSWDPGRGGGKMATHIIAGIRWRICNLIRRFKMGVRSGDATIYSLDQPVKANSTSANDDLLVDRLADRDDRSSRDLLLACMQLCGSEMERAIIASTWDGGSLADVGRAFGVTRSRVHQVKNDLMIRLREEVMQNGGQ